MQGFEYANPTTVQEAVSMLGSSWGEADVLAGGGLRIGAVVTLDELTENAAVKAEYPSLVQAAMGVSSPQIRNMGTVGGDLCQRPRCWYFRQGFGILGQDKNGTSLAPALIALGAKVKVAGPNGSREIPVEQLFTVPGDNRGRELSIAANEIVTEINVPSARGVKNATYEVRQKEALDWPLATASVALKMKGNTIAGARVVLGHVGPAPVTAQDAESMLAGKAITPDNATEAGRVAVNGANPMSGNKYKLQLTRVAVKRALMEAAKARG